jgi:hypothetical protein
VIPGADEVSMPATTRILCSLLSILFVIAGPEVSVWASDDWYGRLARHWAPTIFQDIDITTANPSGRYDLITSADFDGDNVGSNNWENAGDEERGRFPLMPYVYYAVVETRTHYYITYSLFHPRDWRWYLAARAGYSPAILPVTHENDLESATMVILKDGRFGELRLIGTVCHLSNYCFPAASDVKVKSWAQDVSQGAHSVKLYEGRPCLFVESGGHGIGGVGRALVEESAGPYEIGGQRYAFKGDAGIVYRRADGPDYVPDAEPGVGGAGPPGETDCRYQLIPLLASLWPLRHQTGPEFMFERTFDYQSVRGCSLSALPLFMSAEGQDGGANPPWARDATGDDLERGVWFLEPARGIESYLQVWVDADRPGYHEYIRNDYVAGDSKIEFVSDGDDRPRVSGYPMKIGWRMVSGGPGLAENAVLYLSRTGGRTWRQLPISIDLTSGECVWDVTGPASDNCILALRAALGCDANLAVVGWSDGFSITQAGQFGWAVLHEGESPGSPSVRSLTQAIYDPLGDQVVVFGGQGTEIHSDVWAFDFISMCWQQLHSGDWDAPIPRKSHIAVYDSDSHRLVIHGGLGSGPLDDTWLFALEDSLWVRLAMADGDTRAGGVGVYDPIRNRLVVFGGSDGDSMRNDVRALGLPSDQASPQARIQRGIRSPGNISVHGLLRPHEIEWVTLHAGTGPAPAERVHAVGVYDEAGRQFIIHGGLGSPPESLAMADTWAFSMGTNQWELLDNGTGESPSARWHHVGAMDNQHRRLVIFGGCDRETDYGDTWVFDLANLEWTRVSDGLDDIGPGQRKEAMAVLRVPGGQFVVCGGRREEQPLSDVWAMDIVDRMPLKRERVKGPEDKPGGGIGLWPNPSDGDVTISLTMQERGLARVVFYDVMGRVVRILYDCDTAPGLHLLHWDGRDSRGLTVVSGVYFCTILTDASSHNRRVVITR